MKTVAIIGTNGLPAKYGGFETLTNYLVENFDKSTHEIIVYCSKTPKKDRLESYNGAKLVYFPFKANGWQSMIYDFVTIIHALFRASDLIILGFSGAFAFPLNKVFKKNIIFNIGGIEWEKVRGSKFTSKFEIVLKKYMERLCVTNSSTVIIDNLYFKDYIVKKYGKTPVLAEYGGDHAKRIDITNKMIHKYPFLNTDYALSVSRAQEDMNIHLLIEGYKKISKKKIVIISNWHISEYGQKLFDENVDKYDNIILLKAIYDSKELDTIRSNTSLYIHTHSLCGTAPSLVEAMSLNIPVISFDVPTNRYTTENKTLFFKDVSSLIQILKDLDIEKLLEIKNQMFDISKRRYVWKRISKIYQNNLSLNK
jgi:glycosyltransferase involved in cell wall biosynthesis